MGLPGTELHLHRDGTLAPVDPVIEFADDYRTGWS